DEIVYIEDMGLHIKKSIFISEIRDYIVDFIRFLSPFIAYEKTHYKGKVYKIKLLFEHIEDKNFFIEKIEEIGISKTRFSMKVINNTTIKRKEK
ncbi:MAG: hypothetical protein LUH10_11560, partial [Tannerellaceae bacterium]|nr:hypothetical protein [Tannerellaceae bacterium]